MNRLPPDPFRLLVIDDFADGRGAQFWIDLATKHQCNAEPLVGSSAEAVLAKLRPRLIGGEVFHGTILDIGLQREPDGGIRVWERLVAEGLAEMAGELLVATKFRGEDIAEFANRYAGGRLCTSLHRDHRESVFRDFLDHLKARRATYETGPVAPPFLSKPNWAKLSPDVQMALAAVVEYFSNRLADMDARLRVRQ